jgi:uncharacterized protein with GYD domain
MPQYIMLVNFTDQGVKGVKDVLNRQDKSRDLGAFRHWTGAQVDV